MGLLSLRGEFGVAGGVAGTKTVPVSL